MAYFDNWLLFCVLFGLLLIVTFIMMRQSENFYTKDPIVRKFSIMEVEVPATYKELTNIIKGLYSLPQEESQKSLNSLKGQLLLDFIFMPLAYGSIFFLCFRVAHKMQLSAGRLVFIVLAFLQVLPLICDIIENIYLLGKIKSLRQENDVRDLNQSKIQEKKHKRYLWMEAAKWGISLTATVCAISAICYFWLTGNYTSSSLYFMLIVLAEAFLFWLLAKF